MRRIVVVGELSALHNSKESMYALLGTFGFGGHTGATRFVKPWHVTR